MTRKLMKHQQRIYNWARNRDAIALFLDMRLGKSLLTLRWLEAKHGNQGRNLIVAPSYALQPWKEELAQEGHSSFIIHGSEWIKFHGMRSHRDVRYFLINYESLFLRKEGRGINPSIICDEPWSCVILDESIRIKNPQAQVTKTCLRALNNASYRAVLSGMPTTGDLLDVVCQLLYVHGEFMGCDNYWSFRKKYFRLQPWDHKWVPKKGMDVLIRNRIAEYAFVLTREQAGIGSKKIYEKRYAYLSPSARKVYEEVEKDYGTDDKWTKWAVTARLWCHQIAGGCACDDEWADNHKVKVLAEILTNELKGESAVIWFAFNKEIKAVSKALKKKKIAHHVIMGSVPLPQRIKMIKRCQEKGHGILLIQAMCGKYALDLSFADTAIYFSNSDSLENRKQSEDRIIHPKKKRPLLYIDLITHNTVDEDICFALEGKASTNKTFMKVVYNEMLKRRKESRDD